MIVLAAWLSSKISGPCSQPGGWSWSPWRSTDLVSKSGTSRNRVRVQKAPALRSSRPQWTRWAARGRQP